MYEQSCFTDVNLSIFAVLVAVAVAVAVVVVVVVVVVVIVAVVVVVSWTSQIMKKLGTEPRWFTSYL